MGLQPAASAWSPLLHGRLRSRYLGHHLIAVLKCPTREPILRGFVGPIRMYRRVSVS
jgi:hypothetical protein